MNGISISSRTELRRFHLTHYQAIVVVAALICSLLVLWRSIQSQIAHRAYDEANTPETNLQAVDRLASIKSGDVQGLLFALVKSPAANPSNKVEAILRLGNSKNPKIADELSGFLQPHQGLALQDAVSRSLARMDCRTPCISNVLHYLEREYYGEHNEMQDRLGDPGDLAEIQKSVNDNLKIVLTHNTAEAIRQLVTVYGLGSAQPSKYAVQLVMGVALADACPSLLKSREWMSKYERLGLNWKAPVNDAIEHLHCRQP